MSTHRRVTNF